MDGVAILMPFAAHGDDYREAARWYVERRLVAHFPWPVCIGDSDLPWSKGTALARARSSTTADVLVIHDADVLVAPDALLAAVTAVRGGSAWAIPHALVHRLDQAVTDQLLAGGDFPPAIPRYMRQPYRGYEGGGITVVSAAVWDECPVDPRFIGWGGEDEAWAWALGCMYGPAWRGSADLWHLYHPHPDPNARHVSTPQSHLLWRSYRAHRNRPDLMRGILDGARA